MKKPNLIRRDCASDLESLLFSPLGDVRNHDFVVQCKNANVNLWIDAAGGCVNPFCPLLRI